MLTAGGPGLAAGLDQPEAGRTPKPSDHHRARASSAWTPTEDMRREPHEHAQAPARQDRASRASARRSTASRAASTAMPAARPARVAARQRRLLRRAATSYAAVKLDCFECHSTKPQLGRDAPLNAKRRTTSTSSPRAEQVMRTGWTHQCAPTSLHRRPRRSPRLARGAARHRPRRPADRDRRRAARPSSRRQQRHALGHADRHRQVRQRLQRLRRPPADVENGCGARAEPARAPDAAVDPQGRTAGQAHRRNALAAADVPALRRAALRRRLPHRRLVQARRRHRAGRPAHLHRLPLLHDGLPLQGAFLRARGAAPSRRPDAPRGKGCVESCTLCVHRVDEATAAGLRRGLHRRRPRRHRCSAT
ncbi:MAG: hypothetical protein MZW92_78985 [Comamonadaceae bacterium]|nr:hypothetical protein [Comamonadaceae bacterium]